MRQVQKKKRGKIQLDNVDIRSILDDLEIEYFESGKNVSNGWIGTACPWCGDESSHLGLCLESPVASCLKCGEGGNYLSYLIKELGSFDKAMSILYEHSPRELQNYTGKEQIRSIAVNIPDEANTKITRRHAAYLKGRKFNYKNLKKYNLYFNSPFGKWSNRIIVPVYMRKKLVTFTSVSIEDDAQIRYKHLAKELSIVHVKELIYGTEFTNGVICCLVEGLFDMYRIGNGAVTGFGVKLTTEQKKILSKYNKVLVAFDGDKSGIEGAERIGNEMAAFTDVEILDLPKGKDPDKLCKDDLKYIRGKIDGK